MSDLTFSEYSKQAARTNLCPNFDEYPDVPIYEVLAMAGEAGETANKVKKVLRDCGPFNFSAGKKVEIVHELGDTLWYIDAAAKRMGFTLEEIAEININKLHDRHERDTIRGSGDER